MANHSDFGKILESNAEEAKRFMEVAQKRQVGVASPEIVKSLAEGVYTVAETLRQTYLLMIEENKELRRRIGELEKRFEEDRLI